MVGARAGPDREVQRDGTARAQEQGRPITAEPGTVGGDEHVCGEPVPVGLSDRSEAGRAEFLPHLDQPQAVEAEPAPCLDHGRQGREVDRVLALVVGGAAPVPLAVPFGHDPGGEAGPPAGVEAADDIAVAVAEDGRRVRVLDPLRQQHRARGCVRRVDARAGEAQRGERRPHLLLDIGLEVARARRILALGAERHPARKVGLERPVLEPGHGGGDAGVARHQAGPAGTWMWSDPHRRRCEPMRSCSPSVASPRCIARLL